MGILFQFQVDKRCSSSLIHMTVWPYNHLCVTQVWTPRPNLDEQEGAGRAVQDGGDGA